MARRIPRRRLPGPDRRSLHPPDETEDRRGACPEGLNVPSQMVRVLAAAFLIAACAQGPVFALQQPETAPTSAQFFRQSLEGGSDTIHPMHEIYAAMIRLPVAALLGTALALR